MTDATSQATFQLTCPVCQHPLVPHASNLCCSNGHSFDAARQGYWNLLLANQKRSKDPGDNAAMVQARRTFLNLGYYAALAEQVSQQVVALLGDHGGGKTAAEQSAGQQAARLLDMGCGEGYYTQQMQQHLADAGLPTQLAGLDISKHAVKAACRLTPEITWLVASGANIPVADQSLDLISVLFSRLLPDELQRTLKPGGSLLVAYPGEAHLLELRELIYEEVRLSTLNPGAILGTAFQALEEIQVSYPFCLRSQTEIQQLLAMTPHGWRISQSTKDRLSQLETLNLTLDVRLARFTRV